MGQDFEWLDVATWPRHSTINPHRDGVGNCFHSHLHFNIQRLQLQVSTSLSVQKLNIYNGIFNILFWLTIISN